MLNITLSHSAVPIMLYPTRPSDLPDAIPPPTKFSCEVRLKAESERVRVGGVVAIWQLSIKLMESLTQEAEDWEPLETIIVPIDDEEFALASGEEKTYSFDINIPANLPVSRSTPWERLPHVIYVFALAPSPMYSVVPALRDQADVVQDKEKGKSKGLLSSIRRLSLGSLSSGSSDKGKDNLSNGEPRSEVPKEEWSEPTFPKLATPFIAEFHKEIIVTASSDEPGQVNHLQFDKTVKLVGLGDLELHANSDMCILGSCFYNCFRFSNLNPLATIHCYRIVLDQRLISADQAETWVDRFKLFELGRTIQWDNTIPPKDYVWRGASLQAADHARDPKVAVAPSDAIHFTFGPRLPSPVANGRPTRFTWDPSLSSTEHLLEFSFWWSIYGEDANGQPLNPQTEGDMRITTIKTKINIGTCCFNYQNVVAPTYSIRPIPQNDSAGLMEPFARGTEPSSVTLRAESWIEAKGKRHHQRQNYDHRSLSLLQHQVDTDGACACFYPEAWNIAKPDPGKAQVVDGVLELMGIKPTFLQDKEMDALRNQREEDWWKANKKKRKAVPGFAHMLAKTCACERDEPDWEPEEDKVQE